MYSSGDGVRVLPVRDARGRAPVHPRPRHPPPLRPPHDRLTRLQALRQGRQVQPASQLKLNFEPITNINLPYTQFYLTMNRVHFVHGEKLTNGQTTGLGWKVGRSLGEMYSRS